MKALKDSALLSIPAKKHKCNHEVWKDDELLNKYLEERVNLKRGTPMYKVISKKIKKRVGWLRDQKLKMEAEELTKFANKRQITYSENSKKITTHSKVRTPQRKNVTLQSLKSISKTILRAMIKLLNQKNSINCQTL